MKKSHLLFTFLLCLFCAFGHAQKNKHSSVNDWPSIRSQLLSNVSYDLTFYIPSAPEEKVTGMAIITFTLPTKSDIAIDFQGRYTGTFIVNDKKRKIQQDGKHILIPQKYTRPGANRVAISFESRDNALRRHGDYLYTSFSQGQVSTCFPCFDQTDIRATFSTHPNLPTGWKCMASNSRSPISPHLYSFIAGLFEEQTIVRDGRRLKMLYRKQDLTEESQLPKIIQEAAQSLKWMEDYTNLPYPFDECGLLLLPDPQFSAISYSGAICLTDPRIVNKEKGSAAERQLRSQLIAHESAHLWFGNMTSARTRNDIWAKEVLTNYMTTRMSHQHRGKSDHDLEFLTSCQARAMAFDGSAQAYTIAQAPVATSHEAIISDVAIRDKGAVMMRFLEDIVGEKVLQAAVQKFLRKYYYRPASWDDFVSMLQEQVPNENVRQFSDAWVKQKGLPVIHTTYQDGNLIISQKTPEGRDVFLRQQFEVRLIYDFERSRTITVDMDKPTVSVKLSSRPNSIIPNYNGRGYGRFTLDESYTKSLPLRIMVTRNDQNRYALLLTAFDNYLMGRIPPSYFGELYRNMTKEKNPLIMRTAIDHMMKIATDRPTSERYTLEQCIMDLLPENRRPECRQAILRKMATSASAPEVVDYLYNVWQSQSDPLFDEHDYMEMAYRLAITRPQQWKDIISTQQQQLKSDAARQEFEFVSRACNPDAQARKTLGNQLKKPLDDRQKPWAQHALELLGSR